MGFKGKQTLTVNGYKSKHKNKSTKTSAISVKSKLYKQYKQLYQSLKSKYTTSKQIMAINSIMTRINSGTNISSQENRQLALLDCDKLLSLKFGTIKDKDPIFPVMKLVIDMSLTPGRSNLLFTGFGWQQERLRRRRDVRRMMDQQINQEPTTLDNLTLRRRRVPQIERQNIWRRRRMQLAQQQLFLGQGQRIRLNHARQQRNRQAMAAQRAQWDLFPMETQNGVTRGQLYQRQINQYIGGLFQQRPPVITLPIQNTPVIEVNNVAQNTNISLPIESQINSTNSDEDVVVILNPPGQRQSSDSN